MINDESRFLISESLQDQLDIPVPEIDEPDVVYVTLKSKNELNVITAALTTIRVKKSKIKFQVISRSEDILSILFDTPKFSDLMLEFRKSIKTIDLEEYELGSLNYVERKSEPSLCDATFLFKKIIND